MHTWPGHSVTFEPSFLLNFNYIQLSTYRVTQSKYITCVLGLSTDFFELSTFDLGSSNESRTRLSTLKG